MTKSTRGWLFASLVLAFVALPAAFLTLAEIGFIPTKSEGPNQVAAQWFRGLSADELVRAQADIKKLPADQQLFVVRTLPPQGQSEFWRAHLRDRMAADASLSGNAVAAINSVIEALSPELYAQPTLFAAERDAAVARLKSAVDEQTLNELLHLPGEAARTGAVQNAVLESKAMTWLRERLVVSAQPASDKVGYVRGTPT